MNSTAQLSGVNRPLSVELRLINFCACGLDSRGKHDTSFSRGVLTKRSDFPRAKGAVRCSPFGGVEFGKTSRLGSTRKLPQSVDSETGLFWQDLVPEGSPMKKSRFTESQIVAVLKEGE